MPPHDPAPLPPPPAIVLAPAGNAIAARRAFLRIDAVDLVATYPDGSKSEPFPYDAVERRGMDAVVIVAYRTERGTGQDVRHVYLRTALRPPLALRFGAEAGGLWELPAGIIDEGESPRAAAARELEEELGFAVDPAHLVTLGTTSYPAPALIAEKHYFFAIDVSACEERAPTEDGSPLERGAHILHRPVTELLDRCRRGELADAKTELGLRRFAELP